MWVRTAGHERPASASASAALHALFVNKWYFDELIDLADRAAVRRGSGASAARPSSASSSTGRWSAAPPAVVRAGSAAVRAAQSGFLRAYAALLVVGVAAVGLYFLLQA